MSSTLFEFANGTEKRAVIDCSVDIDAYPDKLSLDLQIRLSNFWLLDNPRDKWNSKAQRALDNFKSFRGIKEAGFGKITATALINTNPSNLIRGWTLNGSWESRTAMWMVLHGMHISTSFNTFNIVYFRGLNRDGSLNNNEPFIFNDRRTIFRVNKDAEDNNYISFVANHLATCDPGEYYWENPMNDDGCADIKAWQYRAWSIGDHKGQEALVQTDEVTVLRGQDRRPYTGSDFGIDQHSVGIGQDFSFGDEVGPWSAGCMVGASRDEHDNGFMPIVKSDSRERSDPGNYKHWTTVVNGSDFIDMFPIC